MGQIIRRRFITAMLVLVMIINFLPTVAFAAPAAPTVTAGVESITVSGFTAGATLKLYFTTGTAVATAVNITDATYTFADVVPNITQYYVTQTVGGEESVNSAFTNPSLRTPVATAGIGYIDVGNAYPGATITLYTLGGAAVSSSPTDNGDGTFRFGGLTAGSWYYVVQSINGVVSTGSDLVMVLAPTAPTVIAGLESITVSGFTAGATLKLYLATGGTAVATAINITDATYTFENVVPNITQYYVTQTVEGDESVNSTFVNPSLRIPVATAGIGYINVGNAYPGATITLYTLDGTAASSSPVSNGDGTFRFGGLTAGSWYYVGQSINDVVSTGSDTVMVLSVAAPAAPTVTAGLESITVSGFTAGATLKLYLTTGGTAVATAVNITDATYTFADVVPNITQYYVTQTVEGAESVNSTFVNPSLRAPVATAGIGYIDVGNAYPGATITLYTLDGSAASSSPASNGDGTFRFGGLTAGNSYYVGQSINSVVSVGSNIATVKAVKPAGNTPALVSTGSVSNISLRGARFTGSILSYDGASVMERGFLISTSGEPEMNGEDVIAISAGRGSGEFSVTVDSLVSGKTYYVRTYAINAAGVAYGTTITFVAGSVAGVPITGSGGSPAGIVLAAVGALCGGLILARRRKQS